MAKLGKSTTILTYQFLIGFFLANAALLAFLALFHALVPFQYTSYVYNAHHYIADPFVSHGQFRLLDALAQYDAQWYLKIASQGYPPPAFGVDFADKTRMGSAAYAFFPLYPLILMPINLLLHNITQSAFLVMVILLVANAYSLFIIVKNLYGQSVAIKTAILLFSFPFSIFYRSYFAEGLQLLLLLWFGYSLIRKRLVLAAIMLGLLSVTKGNDLLLYLLFLGELLSLVRRGKATIRKAAFCVLLSVVPFGMWLWFCYQTTSDPFFFRSALQQWLPAYSPFIAPLYNLTLLILTPLLPLHSFHLSMVDNTVVIVTALLLIKSRKVLPPQLWWISLLLWLTPLISKDIMSFSRYQIVSYPLFIYLAVTLPKRLYYILTLAFLATLFTVSLYFVNWWWIG